MGDRDRLWGRQGRPGSLLTNIPGMGSCVGPVSHNPVHTQESVQAARPPVRAVPGVAVPGPTVV